MIKLKTDSGNQIYPCIYDNSVDVIGNYFLIVFTNLQTRISEGRVSSAYDYETTANERLVYFEIIVNLANGYTMQENSFYKYDIYEQTSSSNRDVTDASVLGLRETGKAWVNGTSEVVYVKQPEANKTNSVYLKV